MKLFVKMRTANLTSSKIFYKYNDTTQILEEVHAQMEAMDNLQVKEEGKKSE